MGIAVRYDSKTQRMYMSGTSDLGDVLVNCRHSENAPRVALLTPYDGGNLGDSAIQEAVIANLRHRVPEVEIYGVTLDPARTSVRHGIECYPLTATSTSHYNVVAEDSDKIRDTAFLSSNRRLRRFARKIPLLVWIKVVAGEIRHAIRTYGLLRRSKMLLVAGGGQLDDEWGGSWGHPYALMKWCVLARAAGAEVAFLSVGACRIESRLTRFFLKVALSLAGYRSYRDADSQRLVLGITPRAQGPVSPDLAFSHQAAAVDVVPRNAGGALRVGFSPIAWGHARLWPTANHIQYDRYIAEAALFLNDVLRSGASVTLFSSSAPDDQVFGDLLQRVESGSERLRTCTPTTVEELLGVLRSVDLVVASRLHGVLLSALAAKPAIAISYDRKVTSLMNELGQTGYCVEIESFTRGDLLRLLPLLQANHDTILSTMGATCRQNEQFLQQQYRAVTEMLVKRCARPLRGKAQVFSGDKP